MDGHKTAWFVGAGLAALSGAAFLIRDGHMSGDRITILERLKRPGGALDGSQDLESGFVIRGGREMEDHFEWIFIPIVSSLEVEGASVLDEFYWLTKMIGTTRRTERPWIRARMGAPTAFQAEPDKTFREQNAIPERRTSCASRKLPFRKSLPNTLSMRLFSVSSREARKTAINSLSAASPSEFREPFPGTPRVVRQRQPCSSKAEIPSHFVLRRPWIVNGIRIKPANGNSLNAQVVSIDKYMERHVIGAGKEKFPDNPLSIRAKRDCRGRLASGGILIQPYGSIGGAQIHTVVRRRLKRMEATSESRSISSARAAVCSSRVARRRKRTPLQFIAKVQDNTVISESWDFFGTVKGVVHARFEHHFFRAIFNASSR
ncbi:oleate hydratase [Bradyrhizobium sp. USDA 4473]